MRVSTIAFANLRRRKGKALFLGLGIALGIGTVVALRIQMTALPQLVAAFHSLVGMSAVLVAAAAFYNPAAYGLGVYGQIPASSLVEMSIGTAVGALAGYFGKMDNPLMRVTDVFLGARTYRELLGSPRSWVELLRG